MSNNPTNEEIARTLGEELAAADAMIASAKANRDKVLVLIAEAKTLGITVERVLAYAELSRTV